VNKFLNVVICTYNRAEKLSKVLHSLMEAEIPPRVKVEIIVVDNNSSDDTPRVVQQHIDSANPGVRYMFEGEQGKSHALNTALRHLTGGVIAFTDDDTLVDRSYYAGIIRAIEEHPDYSCFGGKVEAIYPEILPDWLDLNGSMGFLKSAFVDRRDGDHEALYSELVFSHTPSGCNMFFLREAVEDNGDFRTDLGPKGKQLGFAEDTEYCRRLIGKGYRFYYVPSVVVYHPIDPERLTQRYLANWQFQCGKSEALCTGAVPEPRIAGVPRYIFRKALTHLLGWLSSVQPKTRFYHRLRLAYNWGQILGYWQRKTPNSNLASPFSG
jgi:GT2 family glycosyltransferase